MWLWVISCAIELRNGIGRYIQFYSFNLFYSGPGSRKPMNVYMEGVEKVAKRSVGVGKMDS